MAQQARETSKGKAARRKTARKRKAEAPKPEGPWWALTLALLAVVLILRLAVNATEPFPVHHGEARIWALGQELSWGYFGVSPLPVWTVRAVTDMSGDGLFMLRALGVLAHGTAAWLIFLTGRRLWGGASGFWAAAGYTAAPGVSYSSMILSADPFLSALWAGAVYAMIRAAEFEGRLWWAVLGGLTGLGLLAGGGMLGFAAGALAYGAFSARERYWTGTGITALAAGAVILPTVLWSLAEDAPLLAVPAGRTDPDIVNLLEALVVQAAVIGPVFFVAIWLALKDRARWIEDWGMRLMAWLCVLPVISVLALALISWGDGVWAAPAYVAGALLAARWLVIASGAPALKAQLGVGAAAALALWVVTGLYAGQSQGLTRRLDPFAEARISAPICELLLATMAEEGAEVLLSDDQTRLAQCMYYGGLSWDEIAIWNPDGDIGSHYEMTVGLQPGDARSILLVSERGAGQIALHFAEAREIDKGVIETHRDRSVPFQIWSIQGFNGY
ncbi:MAG: glycosyltransferase family 39 protein [Paracoccaceae bacterium]|nr:glycosyltransferase family 39 protein [Paracoccaceae bacterium]